LLFIPNPGLTAGPTTIRLFEAHSENILEASYLALADGVRYKLIKDLSQNR